MSGRRPLRFILRLLSIDSPSQVALGQFASAGLALISAPIVARLLGPTGRGETAAVLAAFYLWPILASLGMQLEVRRAGVGPSAGASIRRARDFMLLLFVPSMAVALLLIVTLFAQLDSTTRIVAFVGIALGPLMISWMCDQSVLIAQRRYRAVGLVQLMQPFTYLVLVLVGWAVGYVSVAYVLGASIVGTAVTAAYAASRTRIALRGPRAEWREFLQRSFRYSGSSIAEAGANRLDQLLALPIIGAYQAGLYAVAATVGGLVLPLGHALAADSFNVVARIEDSAERMEAKIHHIRTALAGGLLVGVLLAIATPIVIPLLFGHEFTGAVPAALVTIVGGIAAAAAYVGSLVLTAEGRGTEMTISQTVRLVVGLALLVAIGPLWGAPGAAVSSATASWVLFAVLTWRSTGSLTAWLVRPSDFKHAVRRLLRGS